ncbi:hypothetical protein ACFQO7_05490 [Catellatospora aurea]|uniref:Uncharacterized protein n=1 Tax=Catellatospora aurea TaxID=1337874 RepID=A0ABW2GSQ3_9ACTN
MSADRGGDGPNAAHHATEQAIAGTALRADLAEAAANALTDDAHLGHGYDLTGPVWTYPQLAVTLGDIAGREVQYHEAAEPIPGPMGFLMGLARSGALERQTGDLARLLGRPPARDAAAGRGSGTRRNRRIAAVIRANEGDVGRATPSDRG